jgi:hypothetical protein
MIQAKAALPTSAIAANRDAVDIFPSTAVPPDFFEYV